jgi:hypothetical protein
MILSVLPIMGTAIWHNSTLRFLIFNFISMFIVVTGVGGGPHGMRFAVFAMATLLFQFYCYLHIGCRSWRGISLCEIMVTFEDDSRTPTR